MRGWEVVNLTLWIVIAKLAIAALILFAGYSVTAFAFVPALVLEGQIWRPLTFCVIPASLSPFFLLIELYFLYFVGSSLEADLGSARFTVVVGLFWLLSVLGALLTPAAGHYGILFVPLLIALLGFRNPNYEILLFFILPVKLKWIALLNWVIILAALVSLNLQAMAQGFAATATFLVLHGADLKRMLQQQGRKSRQVRQAREATVTPFHTCRRCGATDLTHPARHFFYEGGEGICEVCANETTATDAE